MRREKRAVPASSRRLGWSPAKRRGKWVLFAFALFAFAFGACTCGGSDEGIHSTRCDPNVSALARNFDPKIVDECTAENIDDNCSGEADENCQCDNGETRDCSPEPNAGTGACVWGNQMCEYNGIWGQCVGAGHQSQEICDGEDNDCDGATDGEDADLVYLTPTFTSSVSCWTGTSTAVFNEKSYCKMGVPMCIGGIETCTQQVFPLPYEECDTELIDEDCDGEVNEFTRQEFDSATGERVTCGPDSELGICQRGVQVCLGGDLLCRDDPDREGIQPVWPLGYELCNRGVDDDCDGVADENVEPQECGYMACQGFKECVNHEWNACSAPVPVPEICFDQVDNDCDGQTDEDCLCRDGDFQPCFDQVQNSPNNTDCGRGIQFCQPDGTWGDCGYFDTIPELCNLGHDDDCDIATDDTDATPLVCGFDEGECETGLQYCLADGTWENECHGAVWPAIETCGHGDEDCDRVVDNGIVRRNAVAMLFGVDWSVSMCPYLMSYSIAYSTFIGSFAGSPHVCMVVAVPGPGNVAYTPLTSGFVSPEECAAVLANVGCDGGGNEWNLDYLLNASALMSSIPWPSDKFPYIFWLGDEHNQTTQGSLAADVMRVTADVAAQTTTCLLPGCQPPSCDPANGCTPGPPEVFAMEVATYEPSYAAILNNTTNVRDRFCDILLNDPIAYEECLNAWFRDVCF